MFQALVLIALLTLAPSPTTDWVPIMAKIKETKETIMNGQATTTHVKEGSFYRNSEGSTLEEWHTMDGAPVKSRGQFFDNKSGTLYQLHPLTGTAVEQPRIPGVNGPLTPRRAPESLTGKNPEDVVGGVRCIVIPSYFKSSADGTTVRVGESCWSNEYSLTLRRDITQALSNGEKVRTIFEMSEVQFHKDPDPALFDLVGRGFTILAPRAKAPDSKE